MSKYCLILYSRNGCCLCEGLETRLIGLPLNNLNPPVKLRVIDIDACDTPQDVHARYDLQVPVLLLGDGEMSQTVELPRVSPRLNNEALFKWLQKVITKTLGSE